MLLPIQYLIQQSREWFHLRAHHVWRKWQLMGGHLVTLLGGGKPSRTLVVSVNDAYIDKIRRKFNALFDAGSVRTNQEHVGEDVGDANMGLWLMLPTFSWPGMYPMLMHRRISNSNMFDQVRTGLEELGIRGRHAMVKLEYNENVELEFYDRKSLHKVLESVDNPIEKAWKARILFENTPRGNLVMYYDAFKMGFAYYCDQSGIPYAILNAVAMKYVMMFRCLDFFTDEQAYLDNTSPLIDAYRQEEKEENDKKKHVTHNLLKTALGDRQENPFATFKPKVDVAVKGNPVVRVAGKYADPMVRVADKGADPVDKGEKKEHMKNRFLYMGRMQNFTVLQSAPIKAKPTIISAASLPTAFDKLFAGEQSVQMEQMNYKRFKEYLAACDVPSF